MRTMIVTVAFALSCVATAPTTQPTTPPSLRSNKQLVHAVDSQGRCVMLLALFCAKAEQCGLTESLGCKENEFVAGATACGQVAGITNDEAEACASAILKSTCVGPIPTECTAIGDFYEPPSIPTTKSRGI